jgi:protein-disulfide isomerase
MNKVNQLTILTCITLILALVNLTATVTIYNEINSLKDQKSIQELDRGQAPQNAPGNTPLPLKGKVSADDDPSQGSTDATVTIIEYSDFECPYCARFYSQTLSQIRKNYIDNGKVKLVYRDFPLDLHQNARKAAEAAECADEQGKFWEFHDKLYENQNSLDNESLKQYAKDMGLNTNQFNTCLDSGKMTQEVLKDFEDGSSYGVTGTPTLFINGIKVVGAQPYEFFKKIIDQELISNIS